MQGITLPGNSDIDGLVNIDLIRAAITDRGNQKFSAVLMDNVIKNLEAVGIRPDVYGKNGKYKSVPEMARALYDLTNLHFGSCFIGINEGSSNEEMVRRLITPVKFIYAVTNGAIRIPVYRNGNRNRGFRSAKMIAKDVLRVREEMLSSFAADKDYEIKRLKKRLARLNSLEGSLKEHFGPTEKKTIPKGLNVKIEDFDGIHSAYKSTVDNVKMLKAKLNDQYSQRLERFAEGIEEPNAQDNSVRTINQLFSSRPDTAIRNILFSGTGETRKISGGRDLAPYDILNMIHDVHFKNRLGQEKTLPERLLLIKAIDSFIGSYEMGFNEDHGDDEESDQSVEIEPSENVTKVSVSLGSFEKEFSDLDSSSSDEEPPKSVKE